ncbi:MAG: hypothetical protein F6J97_10325 [Leptolyngbya sp. SIO4C1]|nr:hypothetical protein [Leptolyngbya sp. SIO4C1]
MKLLLDENLSDRIVSRIIDLYPDSEHVKTLALTNTDDGIIWEYAKPIRSGVIVKCGVSSIIRRPSATGLNQYQSPQLEYHL